MPPTPVLGAAERSPPEPPLEPIGPGMVRLDSEAGLLAYPSATPPVRVQARSVSPVLGLQFSVVNTKRHSSAPPLRTEWVCDHEILMEPARERSDSVHAKSMRDVGTPPSPSTRLCGPGLAMAAAFIGPGSIATCSQAGSEFGLALLPVLAIAIGACIVLQEMSARLGAVSRSGLGEAILRIEPWPIRELLRGLAVLTLGLGNASLHAGNLSGGGLGLAFLLGAPDQSHACALAVGAAALAILCVGRTAVIANLLGVVVMVMSLLFIVCAIAAQPSVTDIGQALVHPTLPPESGRLATAIVGTTLCAYNLFLHASTTAEAASAIPLTRSAIRSSLRWTLLDTSASALIGGIISASLIITAASTKDAVGVAMPVAANEWEESADPALSASASRSSGDVAAMAEGLTHVLGPSAGYGFSMGLLAAGLSSAITAPLAANLALTGLLPGKPRIVKVGWIGVALSGSLLAAVPGIQPVGVILFAQVANAMLLPCLGAALLAVTSSSTVLGEFASGWLAIGVGVAVVAGTAALSVHGLLAEM